MTDSASGSVARNCTRRTRVDPVCRYWKDPGSFAEYYTTGNTGRFLGFLGNFSADAGGAEYSLTGL